MVDTEIGATEEVIVATGVVIGAMGVGMTTHSVLPNRVGIATSPPAMGVVRGEGMDARTPIIILLLEGLWGRDSRVRPGVTMTTDSRTATVGVGVKGIPGPGAAAGATRTRIGTVVGIGTGLAGMIDIPQREVALAQVGVLALAREVVGTMIGTQGWGAAVASVLEGAGMTTGTRAGATKVATTTARSDEMTLTIPAPGSVA